MLAGAAGRQAATASTCRPGQRQPCSAATHSLSSPAWQRSPLVQPLRAPGATPRHSRDQQHSRWHAAALDGPAAAAAAAAAAAPPAGQATASSNGVPPRAQQHTAAAGPAAQLGSQNGSTPPLPAAAAAAAAASTSAVMASEEESAEGIQMGPQRTLASGLHVRVRDMVKHFSTPKGVFRAVDGVDVDIEPSTICALLGPSGSGKTTLLRLVAGLEVPTGGSIYFDDLDATNLPVQDREVGMVFQSYALFNHLTVADNIKFGLQVRKTPGDHDQRANDLLELVQLTGLGDRYPRQLSGGQRQRVALARALASGPRLLLLDEPFGALDAVVRKQLRAGLKEIVRSVGVTTIIVTHDQEEAFDLADKVVIFNRGLIEQSGAPLDIIKRPATPFVMNFVGDTNSVPATCLLARRSGFKNAQGRARIMFRPGDIQLFTEFRDSVDGHQVTPATVSEVVNMGWSVKYVLRFDDDVEVDYAVTRAQADGALKLDVGERVYMFVRPTAMMAYDDAQLESAPLV